MNKIIEKIKKIKKNFTRDNIFHFLLIHFVPDPPKTISAKTTLNCFKLLKLVVML